MAISNKHNFTNWVDGMKIHKKHFIDSENALIEYIKESNTFYLNKYNYGLLKPITGVNKKAIEIRILKSQTNNFKIGISLCRAITQGGLTIDIIPEFHDEVIYENNLDSDVSIGIKNGNGQAYFVVIFVNPFNRVPYGNPSAEEKPLRNPFAKPDYKVTIIPEQNVNLPDFKDFYFPVARLVPKTGNELVLDDTYIPPCAVIQGHPALISVYNNIIEKLNLIQQYSDMTIQKILSKSQNFPLAQNINKLCLKSTEYIGSVFFDVVNIIPFQPPIFIVRTIVHLASFVNNALRMIPEKEKDEMLQYFKEWNNITPSEFEAMLSQVIDLGYDHTQLYKTLAPINVFINKWAEILQKLSENEIGKKKNTADIMIGQKYEEKKKGFSLLD